MWSGEKKSTFRGRSRALAPIKRSDGFNWGHTAKTKNRGPQEEGLWEMITSVIPTKGLPTKTNPPPPFLRGEDRSGDKPRVIPQLRRETPGYPTFTGSPGTRLRVSPELWTARALSLILQLRPGVALQPCRRVQAQGSHICDCFLDDPLLPQNRSTDSPTSTKGKPWSLCGHFVHYDRVLRS